MVDRLPQSETSRWRVAGSSLVDVPASSQNLLPLLDPLKLKGTIALSASMFAWITQANVVMNLA